MLFQRQFVSQLHVFRNQVTEEFSHCEHLPFETASSALLLAMTVAAGTAHAATDIDLFFPVPVQGKLAIEMQRLIEQFDKDHADIHVTAVYTGSYDDTNLKTRAAIQAGTPPAVG